MRPYLHARRLFLLHQITTKHRGRPTQYSFQTSRSQNIHTNPATDLPLKNKSLLAFLASTRKPHPHPPGSPPAPHIESLSAEPSTSQTLLPQSPLTDPSLTAARLRHTTRKPRPSSSSSSSLLDLNSPTTTTTNSASDISSSFQLKLQQNPFAHALATPVRQCCLTGARLPGECLLAFGLAPHPQTGKMWHLPRMAAARDHVDNNRGEDVRGSSLVGRQGKNVDGKEEKQAEGEEEAGKVDHDGERVVERGEEEKSGVRQDSTAAAPTDTRAGTGNGESIEDTNNGGGEDQALHQQLHQQQQQPPPQRGGRGDPASAGGQSRALSSTYFLNSAQALRHVRRKNPRHYAMMMSHRWREDRAFDMRQVVWREDMDAFVKGLLRRKVVNGLMRLAGRGKGMKNLRETKDQAAAVMVCEEGWEGVEKMEGVSGVLWFGDGLDGLERVIEGSGEKAVDSLPIEDTARQVAQMLKTADGPLPYAMLRLADPDTCISVYNLPKLLGGEQITRLREAAAGTYGRSLTVIRSKGATTTKVQRDLWRLVGYLSDEGEWPSEDR